MLPDPGKPITSLFLGTALSIASVKIVATVIREMNFVRRNVGQIILASAIIDDTIGRMITAIIFSLHREVMSTYGVSLRASRHACLHGPKPDHRPAPSVHHYRG